MSTKMTSRNVINEESLNGLRLKTFFETRKKKRVIRILLPVKKFTYHRYLTSLNTFVEYALRKIGYVIEFRSPVEIQVTIINTNEFDKAYLELYQLREFLKEVKI